MPRRPAIIVMSILAVALVAFIIVFWSKGKAGSTGTFCDAVQTGENPLDVFARYDPASPDGSHEVMRQGVDRLERLDAAAPSEIHDDLKVLVDFARRLTDATDPANRDSPPPDLSRDVDKVGEASGRVVGFARDNCGVELAPESAPSTTESASS